MTQSKNGPKNYIDISPKKTYGWLTKTWKDAQHHSLLEKCKSKPQWRFLKKLGIKPPYDPAIPLLGMYPKITKIEIDTCNPMLIAALLQ